MLILIILQTHSTSSTNRLTINLCTYKKHPSLRICVLLPQNISSSKKNCLLSSCSQKKKKKFFSTENFGSGPLYIQCYWLFPLPSLGSKKQVLHIIHVNAIGLRIYSSLFLSLEAHISYIGGEEWLLSPLSNNLASMQASKKFLGSRTHDDLLQ